MQKKYFANMLFLLMASCSLSLTSFVSLEKANVVQATSTTQNFSKETYFKNLGKYSPNNVLGSCSFVSLSMILSYYDTFRNDHIINGIYERHDTFDSVQDALLVSPGIAHSSGPTYSKDYDDLIEQLEESDNPNRNELIGELQAEKNSETYSYVQSAYLTDFQMRLVFTRWELDEDARNGCVFGWNIDGWQEVLNSYYGAGKITVHKDYKSDNEDDDEFEGEIQDLLDEGKIVSLRVRKEKENANPNSNKKEYDYHAITAYSYDQSGIIAHFGWNGTDDRSRYADFDGWEIWAYAYLEFPGFPEEHSKNYVINGVGYCGCGQHLIHEYSRYDMNFTTIKTFGIGDLRPPILPPVNPTPYNSHRAICNCGHTVVEQHFIYEGTPIGNNPACSGCGNEVQAIRIIERPADV